MNPDYVYTGRSSVPNISYSITPKNSIVLCVGEQVYVSDDPVCCWVVVRNNGVSFCRRQPEPRVGELVLMVR